jgi:hypothetical protein
VRELKPDGTVVWRGVTARHFIYRPGLPGVLLMILNGEDDGEITAPALADLHGAREIFVDAESLAGARPAALTAWEGFVGAAARGPRRASLLAGPASELTLAFARTVARTGDRVQIYGDRQLFAQALAVAAGRQITLPARPRRAS